MNREYSVASSLNLEGGPNYAMKNRKYVIFAGQGMEYMAKKLSEQQPERFVYCSTSWKKFPDGTDDITLEGFSPENRIANRHVMFLASFLCNDMTMSQISVLIVLLQSFIKSMTIVMPFFPVGTMDRVDEEGKVATANTLALIFSSLPSCGKPARLMIYDIHALQERFFFHSSILPSLHTGIPLLLPQMTAERMQAVVFPDEGAAKRFKKTFVHLGYEIIVCGKVRGDNGARLVTIQDGDPKGKRVIIVDDLVQSGGTLIETAKLLHAQGADAVYGYVTHAVFPSKSYEKFLHPRGLSPSTSPKPAGQGHGGVMPHPPAAGAAGTSGCCAGGGIGIAAGDPNPHMPATPVLHNEKPLFTKFYVTNSVPSTIQHLPKDNLFHVLDLLPLIVQDLDFDA